MSASSSTSGLLQPPLRHALRTSAPHPPPRRSAPRRRPGLPGQAPLGLARAGHRRALGRASRCRRRALGWARRRYRRSLVRAGPDSLI